MKLKIMRRSMYFETSSKPLPFGCSVLKASRTTCNGDAKIKWWYWCSSKPKRSSRPLSRMWLFSFVISKITDPESPSAAKRLVPCWMHKHLLNLFDFVAMATVTRFSTLKLNHATSDTLGGHYVQDEQYALTPPISLHDHRTEHSKRYRFSR